MCDRTIRTGQAPALRSSSAEANYRPACSRCNSAKRDRWHGARWAHALTMSAAFGKAAA